MSYTNLPKNATRKAAVTVGSKANYYQLRAVVKPVPTAAELATGEEISLIEVDTGSRYIWVGDAGGFWYQTHLSGALNVHTADVHHIPINQYFHLHSGTITTVAIAAAVNDTSITVVNAASFTVGDSVNFYSTVTGHHWQAEITVIAGNLVTLDRPLDFAMPVGYTMELVVDEMAVAGSLVAPIIYKIFPPAGEVWHITRIIAAIVHTTAGDLGLFGDLATLTNGMVFRSNIDGVYNTFTNWKHAADFKNDMFTVEFDARSGGGGVYGTSAKGDFKEIGVAVRLDGTVGDWLEIRIQDASLVGLISMRIKGQGHVELE